MDNNINQDDVLVTGGACFIGSHVVDILVEHGYRVTVLDNLSTGSIDNLNSNAEFYNLDIRDVSAYELILKVIPMALFH
jgi:UDP-glucose 4-epimerase